MWECEGCVNVEMCDCGNGMFGRLVERLLQFSVVLVQLQQMTSFALMGVWDCGNAGMWEMREVEMCEYGNGCMFGRLVKRVLQFSVLVMWTCGNVCMW